MGKRYDLTAEGIRVTLEGGVLRSLRGTGESGRITYINPQEGFGRIFLTWKECGSGKQHSFFRSLPNGFWKKSRKKLHRECAAVIGQRMVLSG